MSVLAFLQNGYTSSEDTAKQLERMFADARIVGRMQHARRQGLFDGSNYTGLTIQRYFGEKMVRSIWWENASPRWGWKSSHKFPADLVHMRRICEDRLPSVVLAFGKSASLAVQDLWGQADSPLKHAVLITGPHPAARDPRKYDQLRQMHAKLLTEADFDECPHCHMLSTGGSHCNHCLKELYPEEEAQLA